MAGDVRFQDAAGRPAGGTPMAGARDDGAGEDGATGSLATGNGAMMPGPPVSEALALQAGALPAAERRILDCLGAAVVIAWNQLPTDVQRTLFRLASAPDGEGVAGELPARIARFLHDHKDDADHL